MRTVTFIATPARSGKIDASGNCTELAVPFRMEVGTLTFNEAPHQAFVTVKSRSGDIIHLDRDAAVALIVALTEELKIKEVQE